VALIVIHGHDAVECSVAGTHEERVAWPGTADLQSLGLCLLDGWGDEVPDKGSASLFNFEGKIESPPEGFIGHTHKVQGIAVDQEDNVWLASNANSRIVVFPGGGYNILAFDLEGTEVCEWLNSINVTCVLLKYRVPDSGPYPKSAAALQDAQRAIGMVRTHAADWSIDPHRIGVLGFSAGGHLSAALSTHFEQRVYDPVDSADQQSCRPDFAVLVYPAYLSAAEGSLAIAPEIRVTQETPSAFVVQAEDDHSYIDSSLAYFAALKNAKVPAELHIYAEGGHGYGLRRTDQPVTRWPELVESKREWNNTAKYCPGIGKGPLIQIGTAMEIAQEQRLAYPDMYK